MLRVVVDPGVLIAGLISAVGSPAEILRRWTDGQVQLIISEHLLDEFITVCRRDRFRRWFSTDEADALHWLLRESADLHPDTEGNMAPPADPMDAYLVHLAAWADAHFLVTGDARLLDYRNPGIRTCSPNALLRIIDELSRGS